MSSLIKNLRDLAALAHADVSVADEAADEIERLRAENDDLKKMVAWSRFSLTEISLAAKSKFYEDQLAHIEKIAVNALERLFAEQKKNV